MIKTIKCSSGSIICFPSVTGYYNGPGGGANNYYVDIIICKWVFNGVDYNDRCTTAKSDCSKAGASYSLESQTYISDLQTTPTNDSAMINKYISSSARER